jgi:hypothetical protein
MRGNFFDRQPTFIHKKSEFTQRLRSGRAQKPELNGFEPNGIVWKDQTKSN